MPLTSVSEARKLFERALALDPGNVDAIVGAALASVVLVGFHMSDDRAAAWPQSICERDHSVGFVAYRLAGLSALGAHYAGVKWGAMLDKRLRPTPSFRGSAAEIARAVEKPIEVTPQGWADRGAGCAARPLRWWKKEGNERLRRVGTEGVFALRARPHATGTNARYPIRAFCSGARRYEAWQATRPRGSHVGCADFEPHASG